MSNIVGIMGKMTPSASSLPSPPLELRSSSLLGDNCNPGNIMLAQYTACDSSYNLIPFPVQVRKMS